MKQITLLLLIILILGCANRGTPTGGEIDIEPPIVLKSSPKNFTTNFKSDEIEIIFNEYIRLKNLQNELIISPPIDPLPLILPIGSASKILNISELDSLKENTTYSFHFGESIEDNNERNPLSNFRYVLSTGNFIDSLVVKGAVYDAFNREISENINVLLYEVDSTHSDSIVFKEKPKYVAKVIDSTNQFIFQNIKKGDYQIIALEEEDKDYTYQNKVDKIGFNQDYIQLPNDSLIFLRIFKENLPFKIGRAKQKTNRLFSFGYEGEFELFEIKILKPENFNYSSRITRDKKSDSLLYWLKTDQKLDSVVFNIYNDKFSDTLKLNLRNKENDSLVIKSQQNKTLKFNENFSIEANLPFQSIDKSKISVMSNDSTYLSFETIFDTINNKYSLIFEKQEDEEYRIELVPGALIDFFENTNDSLYYKLSTKTYNDYGNLSLNLINAQPPMIIELTNQNGEVKYDSYITKKSLIEFKNIDPAKYYIRIIFDDNKNKKYDSGNFLNKTQPEKVVYFPEEIDVRAGWDLVQEFILQ